MAVENATGAALDLRRVAEPSPIFRPAPFWSWNEVMEPREVRRQVHELARGGLGGGFIHVRVGLITKYMGEESDWEEAEGAIRDALVEVGHPFVEAPGEAAFYGPSWTSRSATR